MMTTPRQPAEKKPLECRIPEYCIEYEMICDYADKIKNNIEAFEAFTWVPDPRRYRSTDPYRQWEDLLENILLKPEMDIAFEAYMFVPELTLDGNIHVHGVYSVRDNIKLYRWFYPACKKWGWTKTKKNIDDDWTRIYLAKTIDIMSGMLEPLPVIIQKEYRNIHKNALIHENMMKNAIKVKHTPKKIVQQNKKTGIMKYF